MNLTTLDTAHLQTRFEEFEKQLNGQSQSAWHQIRRKAIANFEKLGFPTTKNEEWKYTNVQKITKNQFDFLGNSEIKIEQLKPYFLPEFEANILVFVNGVFKSAFSKIISPSQQINLQNLKTAYQNNPELIDNQLNTLVNSENESFTALNTAFAEEGVFLQVFDNQVVEKPILVYYFNDAQTNNVASQPRNLLIFGKNSQATLIEKYDTLGENASLLNTVTEIFVAENAHIRHYKIQNESPLAYQINTTQVSQKRDSNYSNITISLQGAMIRNNLNISLDGENIESNMLGLYMLDGKTHVDNHTIADHLQPNSVSNELYKGILDGQSTGVFNGKIFVRKDAQKTNAYQQNRNVLLSDAATINTKPQLEIWADDVKCSHGATTGSLDETALFYLRARGIPPREARALLVHAFGYEILEKIDIEPIREYLNELLLVRLKND